MMAPLDVNHRTGRRAVPEVVSAVGNEQFMEFAALHHH